MNTDYANPGPTRAEVDAIPGPVLLEFGTPWCGYCRAVQPLIVEAVAGFPELKHLKVEDGSGRALGRSFGVKLWPTLVFLRDGHEVMRLVRPRDQSSLAAALDRISVAP